MIFVSYAFCSIQLGDQKEDESEMGRQVMSFPWGLDYLLDSSKQNESQTEGERRVRVMYRGQSKKGRGRTNEEVVMYYYWWMSRCHMSLFFLRPSLFYFITLPYFHKV